MATQLINTKENMSVVIKRVARKATAFSVSLIVFFIAFSHVSPDYKLIQGHKVTSYNFAVAQYAFAGDSGDGGDGGDSGDGGDGAGGDSGDGGGSGDSGDGGSGSGDSGDGGGSTSGDSSGDGGSAPALTTTTSTTPSSGDAGGDSSGDSSGGDSSGDSGSGDGGTTPTPSGGPGSIGGPGGLNAPSVSLSSIPGAGEQPLAFITLSQVPYTGFKAGTLLASFYYLMLILWSGVIAYVFFVRKTGSKILHAVHSPFRVKDKESYVVDKDEEEFIIQSIVEEQEKRQRNHVQQEPVDFPINEHSTFSTDAIVIETDANGQSPRLELRRTGVAPKQKIQNQYSTPQPIPSPIYKASHITSEHNTQETTPTSVIEVIRTIVQGNTPHLLEIIQEHKATRKEISDILIQALCELDRLYARRMGENETLKDESVEDLFENWDNKDIGKLVHVLSTGIDQNYLTQHTSAKMALLRGLECAQEVKNK